MQVSLWQLAFIRLSPVREHAGSYSNFIRKWYTVSHDRGNQFSSHQCPGISICLHSHHLILLFWAELLRVVRSFPLLLQSCFPLVVNVLIMSTLKYFLCYIGHLLNSPMYFLMPAFPSNIWVMPSCFSAFFIFYLQLGIWDNVLHLLWDGGVPPTLPGHVSVIGLFFF